MIRWIAAAAFVASSAAAFPTAAFAEEAILGNWNTLNNETALISACGDAYCITVVTGKFKGRQIGKMRGSAGSYTGEVTDPAANKTYSGSAIVSGATLKLSGCVMKVFCKTQTWSKK